jgi:hypothetical protein
MKIEEVIPEVPPEFHIVLNQEDYNKLMTSAYVISTDSSWSTEYKLFFGDLYKQRIE